MTNKKVLKFYQSQSPTDANKCYVSDIYATRFSLADLCRFAEAYAAQQSEMPTEIYAAIFNPMIHESGFVTLSLHRTQKGAEMAMEFHKAATIDEDGKLDDCKYWDVVKMKIED